MLSQFSVKNYKSIKEIATIDMQATNITEFENDILIDKDNNKFLPLCAIYGPNGGGKSNILDALYCFVSYVLRPICAACDRKECNGKQFNNKQVIPFKLDNISREQPTEFEVFFRTKMAEYKYVLKISYKKIEFESLSKININGKRIIDIFIRDPQKNISYLNQQLNFIQVENITDTLPWLSYFSITNKKIEVIRDVITWFHSMTFVNYGNSRAEENFYILQGKYKDIQVKMFKEMDINVDGYEIKKSSEELNEELNTEFITIHNVNGNKVKFDLSEESSGTIKLFNILPLIIESLYNGETLVVDELDAKLHPSLLEYIIKLFRNKESNKKSAQLIFTSHDMSTMTPKLFRRDEIWFAAKDNFQATNVYSLVEFKKENGKPARNDEKYGKQYLEGRYGADPYLRRIINWEEVN